MAPRTSPTRAASTPELFGWSGRIAPEPEASGYTAFLLAGRAGAGAGLATRAYVPV